VRAEVWRSIFEQVFSAIHAEGTVAATDVERGVVQALMAWSDETRAGGAPWPFGTDFGRRLLACRLHGRLPLGGRPSSAYCFTA
jgi:hypothetical protein